MTINARIADTTRLFSFPKIGPAQIKAVLGGTAEHWALGGVAAGDRVSGAGFALARLSGPFQLESRGGDLSIKASAAGEGGNGRGLAAALLGARPRGSAAVTLYANGRVLMRELVLDAAGLKVRASGDRGLLGNLSFRGAATVSNLSFAHPGAKGVVTAAWTAAQGSARDPWAGARSMPAARAWLLAWVRSQGLTARSPAPHFNVKASLSGSMVSVASANLQGAAGSVSRSRNRRSLASQLALELSWRAQGPFTIGPAEIDGAAVGFG